MIFRKSKYNIIFILMFMLVIGVFGFEVFFSTQTEIVIPDIGSDAEQEGPGGEGDVNDPSIPDLDEGEEEDDFDKNAPTDTRFPKKILTYAINKLYNSDGYKSTYSKTMTNVAMGMEVTQEIKGTIDKSGDKALEKLEFRAKGQMADMAANYLRYFYFEGNNVTEYQTPKKNYDFSSAIKREMTREQYNNTYRIALPEKTLFNFSSDKFSPVIDTQTNGNKDYYIIQVSTRDSKAFPDEVCKYYEASGDLANVTGVNCTYSFYIYKDSAKIFKIKTEENYSGSHPGFGVGVSVHVSTTQIITAFDTKFNIEKP